MVGKVVITGNGQVVVGTCVNFGSGTVVFDIAAGNGGVIAFSIGAAVEFNGHTGSHGLSAADRGKTRNAEVALQFVSLNNGQVAVTAGAGAVNGGGGIVDHGGASLTGDDTGVVVLIGIGTAVEGHGHVIGKVLCIADLGFARNAEAVSKIVTGGNTQSGIETAHDLSAVILITDFAAVSRTVFAEDLAVGLIGRNSAVEVQGRCSGKNTVEGRSAADGKAFQKVVFADNCQSGIISADHSLVGNSITGGTDTIVGDLGGIIRIRSKGIADVTAEDRTVVNNTAVEGEICISATGEDRRSDRSTFSGGSVRINGKSTVNDQGVSEVVISGNGQITVFTTVDVGCCGIFDITAVDDTLVTGFFCIGLAAEDHFTVDSQFC